MGIPSLVSAYKGKYNIKNLDKYVGEHECGIITYRSRWEKHVMKMLDENPNVLKWANEPFPIMYLSPMDGNAHRYFPDFYCKLRKRNGKVVEGLIEVKPKIQASKPRSRSRKTKRYVVEQATYAVNMAKWESAKAFCDNRGWFFQIMTEDDIFGSK